MLPLKQQRKVTLCETDEEQNQKQPQSQSLTFEELKEFSNDILKISHSSKSKSVLARLKTDSKETKFVERVTSILDKFDKVQPNDCEKLEVLFLFVMQTANDILGNNEQSDEICLQLLKKFVNDDEYLTRNVMNIVKTKVKPLTMYRKYKHRMYKFFFTLASMFLKIK